MIKKITVAVVAVMLVITVLAGGCAVDLSAGLENEGADGVSGYVIVTGAEAKELFESNENVILLDVRNQGEFDVEHLDGSVLIPVDQLESRLSELPDKDAVIIIYCRAGRRSALASEILVASGYTNVYDMQSIHNWG